MEIESHATGLLILVAPDFPHHNLSPKGKTAAEARDSRETAQSQASPLPLDMFEGSFSLLSEDSVSFVEQNPSRRMILGLWHLIVSEARTRPIRQTEGADVNDPDEEATEDAKARDTETPASPYTKMLKAVKTDLQDRLSTGVL